MSMYVCDRLCVRVRLCPSVFKHTHPVHKKIKPNMFSIVNEEVNFCAKYI